LAAPDNSTAPERRPEYAPPRVARLGDLARLTQNVGSNSNKDGGKGGMARSQP
jgi:hypothetical protein